MGPTGPKMGHPNIDMNVYSTHIKDYTYKIIWLYYLWFLKRRCLKLDQFWAFWALPKGPCGAHAYNLNKFESPTLKDDSLQVWLKSIHPFRRRRRKCKSLRTMHDARRTTDAGQKWMAIAHLSILLRWAKKKMVLVRSVTSDYYFTGKKTCNVCMIPMFCLTNVLGIYRALLSKLHKACDRSWILANVSREQSIFLIILFSLFISHSVEFVFYFFYNYSSIGAIKRPHI